jgi:hypothetical protein
MHARSLVRSVCRLLKTQKHSFNFSSQTCSCGLLIASSRSCKQTRVYERREQKGANSGSDSEADQEQRDWACGCLVA